MNSRLITFGLAGGIFLLDRLTKLLIQARVSLWDTYVVIPNVFNIVHTQNRGAAFGLLSDSSSELRVFFLVGLSALVLAFVAALLWQSGASSVPLRGGLALILGGALGNIWDRVLQGSVTDFLQVYVGTYEWPAFNVADSAITIGAGLLLLDMWRARRQPVRT